MAHYETTLTVRCSLPQAYEFHTDTRNLARISPAFPKIILLDKKEEPLAKEVTLLFVVFNMFRQRLTLAVELTPYTSIIDEQLKGPFNYFRHSRTFHEVAQGVVTMHEIIDYDLPFGPLGKILDSLIVAPQLRRMFAYRHKRTKEILELS